MRFEIHLSRPVLTDMGVDLSGAEESVPQKFLDDPQVCATVEHVGGKGMS
jgi:hypothetical protein